MTEEDVLADLVGRIDDLPLPCPWCGRSDTELLCTPGSLSWSVGCKCGATGPRARVANDAVKKWNEPPDARLKGWRMMPCPNCGRSGGVTTPWIQESMDDGRYRAECLFCGACGPWADSEEEAVRKWRKRE